MGGRQGRGGGVARALVAALALGGCDARGPEPAARGTGGDAAGEPLEVLFTGCDGLRGGSTCALAPAAELRLWVAVHPGRPLTATIDGAAIDGLEVAAEDGGQRLRVRPPAGARALEVAAPGRPPWRMNLTETTAASEAAAARASGDAAFRAGDYRGALAAYEPATDALLAEGHARAASDVALTAAFVCAELLFDLDCAAAWIDRHAGLVAAFPEAGLRHSYYRGRLAERRGDLRRALADYEEHATLSIRLGLVTDASAALLSEAVLRGRIGDLEGSAAAARRVQAFAAQIAPRERARIYNNIAWTWILARDRGDLADGWVEDPRPLLREALAIFADEAAGEPANAAEVRVNLAFAALLDGDRDAAAAELAASEGAALRSRAALWRDYVAARLRAAEGDHAAALRRFEAIGAAAQGLRGELAIRAAVGRGLALAALGQREAGLAALLEAERVRASELSTLAIDGGRERLAAASDRSARAAVSLLLELGRPAQARCVARLARGRSYEALARLARHGVEDDPRGLRAEAVAAYQRERAAIEDALERSFGLPRRDGEAQREALRRRAAAALRELDAGLARLEVAPIAAATCEELRDPAPGELLLVFAQGDAGWLLFSQLGPGGAIRVEPVAPPPASDGAAPGAEAWARALAEARGLGEELGAASRVRVVASGVFVDAPIHAMPIRAMPFAGAPLYARLPVAFSLDLPRASSGVDAPERGRGSALVVAAPSNLEHAAAEVERVTAGLDARGVEVEVVDGALATGAAVREQIGDVDLLHFVGHAQARGGAGWDAALELAGESTVTVADLIALPRGAPREVVLSGCRTGLADPRAAAGGMSLAHALLVAGAQTVLATTEDVDDAAAFALISAIYAALAGDAASGGEDEDAIDLVAALAKAQATLAAGPGCAPGGCASFRAWVR
ncbi:MAG: CHAT domain-containing protein [Nannocystaceae bacterium]